MTARERLLAILHKDGAVDRPGWSPLIDGYFMSSFPPGTDILEVFRDVGADILERHVFTWEGTIEHLRSAAMLDDLRTGGKGTHRDGDVTLNVELRQQEDGTLLIERYEIPGRTLTRRSLYNSSSPFIAFPLEQPIKSVEDLEAYAYIRKRQRFLPLYDRFVAEDARIGEGGLATDSGVTSPVQELLQHLIGIEPFYTVFHAEHREELESLMKVMHQSNMALYEVISRSPADIVIDYENTSTTFISPDLYRQYSFPAINDYADLLHSKQKMLLTHRCGTLKALLPILREGRDDGIVDISPEPTGDVAIWEAKEALPGKIVLGGFDATFLVGWSADKIRNYTREIIARSGGPERLIIGSADAVPKNARIENLKTIAETVRQMK